MQGPYTGSVNMCSFEMTIDELTCGAYFDSETGEYEFICTDMDMFPPGTYTFVITVTIGSSSTQSTFTMTLENPCVNDN
jgi:hypothetical protein